MDYSCTYVLPGVNGEGSATATFDSGIGEGLVLDVGDEVPLDPVTGSVTVASGFVDALRAAGVTEISGGGEMFIIVPGTVSARLVNCPSTPRRCRKPGP